MSLEHDGPLFLSYMVCGGRESFQILSLRIDVSGVRVTPSLGSSSVPDSNAEMHGVSVTVQNRTSQMCKEVLVRVWTDHPNVQNAFVYLVLIFETSQRVPETFRRGRYFLFSPDDVTTQSTTSTTTSDAVTSETTTSEAVNSETATSEAVNSETTTEDVPAIERIGVGATTDANAGEGNVRGVTSPPTPPPTTLDCATLNIVTSAVLGSLLVVAVVIIIVLVVVVMKLGRKGVRRSKGYAENAGSPDTVSTTADLEW